MNIIQDLEDKIKKYDEDCLSMEAKDIIDILLKEVERLRLELLRLKGY